jgi:hypothetical protein
MNESEMLTKEHRQYGGLVMVRRTCGVVNAYTKKE